MPELIDLVDVRARLEDDRPWAAFSLADLDQVHATHATWFGPPDGRAVVLVYRAYDPPIVICHGDGAGCDAELSDPEVARSSRAAHLNVRPELLPVAMRHFRVFEQRRMVRMLLDGKRFTPASTTVVPVRLGPADLDEVRALYAEEPPAFFLPAQLQDGVYFGVREGRDLIAVAGTHVVSGTARVGALGNVHTRRDRRREGLAAGVASGCTNESGFASTAPITKGSPSDESTHIPDSRRGRRRRPHRRPAAPRAGRGAGTRSGGWRRYPDRQVSPGDRGR
jgi:hypothetical protein